jgi:hypothetical protein
MSKEGEASPSALVDIPKPAFGQTPTRASTSVLRATVLIIAGYAVLVLALVPIAGMAGPELPGLTAVFAAVLFLT